MGMVGLRDVLVVTPAASFHHHHHHDSLLHNADHSVLPLDDNRGKQPAGIQFWQAQQPGPQQDHHLPNPNPNPNLSYQKKPVGMLDASGISGYATCQDCGNQAKKDCIHRRCRTCCKSRGYDCSTHVKSTWVPAARRRERQQFSASAAAAGSSASTSAPKKPRLISSQTTTTTSTSNTTPRSTSSSHQDASFREGLPGHVRAPAVFKCVRVTSMEDGEDEYAYQAMVRIGGHTFKGFLYDQGLDNGQAGEDHTHITAAGGGGDGNNNTIPNISELHLGGASSSGAAQADAYGGFLGGTNYGNQIN